MTEEQKDKILKAIADDRNDYARSCNERIAKENGKIEGADYMLQRFLDVLRTEVEPQEGGQRGVIIIFKLIGVVAIYSALITILGMKLVEWWECRK